MTKLEITRMEAVTVARELSNTIGDVAYSLALDGKIINEAIINILQKVIKALLHGDSILIMPTLQKEEPAIKFHVDETTHLSNQDWRGIINEAGLDDVMDYSGTKVYETFKPGDKVSWNFANGSIMTGVVVDCKAEDVEEYAKMIMPLYGIEKYGGENVLVFIKNEHGKLGYIFEKCLTRVADV